MRLRVPLQAAAWPLHLIAAHTKFPNCSATRRTPACLGGGRTLTAAHLEGPCSLCAPCASPAHTVADRLHDLPHCGPRTILGLCSPRAGLTADRQCRTPACQAHQQVSQRSAPLQVACLRKRWQSSDSGPLAPKDLAKAVLLGRPPSRQDLSGFNAGRQQHAWGSTPKPLTACVLI